jgi:aflatoxin B1 aldehyde reductase
MSSGVKIAMGGASFGEGRAFNTAETANTALDVLRKHGVQEIDSALIYPGSEALLGSISAGSSFAISTKSPGGFVPGSLSAAKIEENAKGSLERLGLKQVDIYYLHSPDRTGVPVSEVMDAVQKVYESGAFRRFGVSNFSPEEVRAYHDYAKSKGYVLPTVFQGNYNPVARRYDATLFPVLRELGISFYAYSPLAGGFLTKTKEQVLEGAGRFNKGHPVGAMYAHMYARPAYLEALQEWDAVSQEAGCSKAELAYRWVRFNSILKPEHGDALIVGASRLEQLDQTLAGLEKGPLSREVVERIDKLWKTIEHEAPLDNYTATVEIQKSNS